MKKPKNIARSVLADFSLNLVLNIITEENVMGSSRQNLGRKWFGKENNFMIDCRKYVLTLFQSLCHDSRTLYSKVLLDSFM